ncbi:MAG: putative colanic acid biosynthesis acetyltransferase [Planctomycetes bacterium]|nr:putative colanic acid biosynthesis acetyltransferase [Planctomycetota bacterium]
METETDNSTQNIAETQKTAMEQAPPQRRTVWTRKQKVVRLLWGTFGRILWVFLPHARSSVLRLFGAKIGRGCTFARSVEIIIPWNLKMGNNCHFSEHVILYTLGTISLGDDVRIDTKAHLCAGSHDMRDTTFPLTRPPISIGSDSFIGIDAYVAPNVSLGENTIVHPRASVYRSFDGGCELQGNPARVVE